MEVKKILCFGDSNTWGYIPGSALRYDEKTRWTGILQNLLKDRCKIIEAGCCNRTCFIDNPDGIEQSGYRILPKYLDESFDVVILSLGINDIQKFFNPDLNDIKTGIEQLIKLTKELCPKAKIIVVSPASLTKDIETDYFRNQFDKISIEKSKHFSRIYEKAAQNLNCLFFDWDKIVKVSDIDGLHFSPEAHRTIAYALYDFFCVDMDF